MRTSRIAKTALTLLATLTIAGSVNGVSWALPANGAAPSAAIQPVKAAASRDFTANQAANPVSNGAAEATDANPTYPQAQLVFPGNDHQPHKVTYDKNSFLVDGQRLNIWSGELHYWRIPDVNGWRDLMQKMRANGYNAVSLYFFWGLHQSQRGGDFDFTPNTVRDLDQLLTIAQEEGLYVIARPGPYINAEISMGGLPAYLSNSGANLRSTDPEVLAASKAWLHAFDQIAAKHLVTNGGGSVLLYQVENELLGEEKADFLNELVSQVKADGIDVPLFHNDYSLGGRFADHNKFGLDFYAYDMYPVGFNCAAPRNTISDSEAKFRSFAPDTPHFITESQGGAFTPWGATYNASDCYAYTDENFTRQWAVNNIGNGVTAFNFYMAFGGTNWGWTGSPSSGFTSYDYGAGITEDRALTAKSSVQKEMGYFERGVKALTQMDPVAAPSAQEVTGASLNVYSRLAATGSGSATGGGTRVLAIRHTDSNATDTTTFTLPLSLGATAAATPAPAATFSHDDRDAQISYQGTWAPVTEATAAQQTLTRTSENGASATLKFTGTGVRVIVGTGVDHGTFSVSIDGAAPVSVTAAMVDTEQNKPTQLVAFAKTDLAAGEHTVVVTNTGSADRSVLSLDAFDVVSASASAAPATAPDAASADSQAVSWAHIPQAAGTTLTLHGRDALLLTADALIAGKQLYYTTSQIFGEPIPGAGYDTQYLVGYNGDPGETVFHFDSEPQVTAGAGVSTTWDATTGQLRLNYTHSAQPQTISIVAAGSRLDLRIIDRETAQTTWILDARQGQTLIPVAIEGVELARTATINGATLELTGSVSQASQVVAIAPPGITAATWNGAPLAVADGVISGTAPGAQTLAPIKLSFVKATDNAYAATDFDDSSWLTATDTQAANAQQGPGKTAGVVLDSNHYGFYEGSVWYRAHYTAAAANPTLTLTGNGGTGQPAQGKNPAFMQVWANGTYVGALPANGQAQSLPLPSGLVAAGSEVTLAVLVNNLGQNLDWSNDGLSQQNRGLYDADLQAAGAVTWKLSGATATDMAANNPSGTLYNNGGLQGEQNGWHMPAFDDSTWSAADSLHSAAGVTWYRAHVALAVPAGEDAAFRLDLESTRAPSADLAQATIFVNGWNTGVYIGDVGPQTSFTIPQAFLNLSGDNVIAIAVAAKADGMGPESVTLRAVHTSTLPTASSEAEPSASATDAGSGEGAGDVAGAGDAGSAAPTAGASSVPTAEPTPTAVPTTATVPTAATPVPAATDAAGSAAPQSAAVAAATAGANASASQAVAVKARAKAQSSGVAAAAGSLARTGAGLWLLPAAGLMVGAGMCLARRRAAAKTN